MNKLDDMKKQIFDHMLATRSSKYKWFLRALRTFKYASMNPIKGDFLESYYVLMRYVDDIVDGDAQLPKGYKSSEEFVQEKIDFSKHLANPKDSVDALMLYCFELGNKFGEDFSNETLDILSSLLFDSRRYGTRKIFSSTELEHHFHLLDVRGTIGASLKVFGEDAAKYPILAPLGFATRIYYNLRDYDEDIKAGLVNISSEDCQKFNIRQEDLENRLSSGVQAWFDDQTEQGIALLKKHRKTISEGDFGILTRLTLPLVFEKPAKKYFEKKVLLNY